MTLDTSVLFDAVVDGPLSVKARQLLSTVVILRAPDLLDVEIAGAVTRAVRRGIITSDVVATLLARARRVRPDLDASSPLLDRAVALSLELAHPTADCVFLAHAEAAGDVVVTADSHFVRKVAPSRHGGLILHLSDWQP